MAILYCYVDEDTLHWLEAIAVDLGRPPVELAEAAIANAVIEFKSYHMQRAPVRDNRSDGPCKP